MNQSHSTSNSPALSAGGPQGGGVPPGGGGGYLAGPHPSQPQHQAAGRQDMTPQLVYMPQGSSVPYRAGLQQAQYLQSFNPLMQRPTMMNSQLPQQQQQQQQQMLHQQQQQQQQQQQYVTQMRPPPMVAGPRYSAALPHFPSPSQTGYMQPQQDQPMYHQVISPPEHLGYIQNIHPSFYPHLQMQQQVQQRPEASSQVFGGGQIQPNAQPWQVYPQGANMAQFYQPVVPARYQQPVARHMMPTMQPNVGIQPQEMTGENAVTISQMTVPDTIQPRQSFLPRNSGTVYYDPNPKPEGEDRGHAARPPARRAIAIIDPDTGKNVLESLDSNQRPTSDEALQIQSEFSKKVTQRIALGDKAYDQNEFTVPQPGHIASAQPKSAKPLVEKEAGDQPESGILTAPTPIAETFAKPEVVKTEEALGDAEKCLPAMNLGLKEEVDLVLERESMDSAISLPFENSSLVCKMEEEEKEEEAAEVHEVKVHELKVHEEEEQSVTDPEDIQEDREEDKVMALPVEDQTVYTECKVENAESECIEENTDVQVTESVSSKEFVPDSEPGKDGSPIHEVNVTEDGDAIEPQVETIVAKEDLESQNGDDGESSKTEDDAVSESGDSRSRYSYEPGQWSPLNPDGKKVYGRDFLLQLQYIPESTQTPPGLPNLPEIIRSSMPPRDSAREHSFPSLPANSNIDFMPRYAHERASMGKVPIKRNSFQKRSDPPVKIITIQRSEDVRLHKTEQAWKPAAISKDEPLDPEMSKTEELYKKVRGILNKITPSTFDRLINQVTELPIDNENRLSGCIKILFEKAISEPKFVKAYSNMAHRLSSHNVQCDDNPEKKVSFRKLLLNRCQEEFEKDKEDELDIERREKEIEETATGDKKKLLIEAKEQAIMKSRRRSLGNIRFIGELFKLKMLTEAIMHDCVKKLLNADDEDSLELLCNLLTTIGKELDTEKARRSMDSYFTKLSSKKGLPPRIRFMIQDLFELRENKWVPRRAENIPKTIDQIHREAHEEKELAKQQMLARPAMPPPKSRRPAGLTSSLEKGTDDGWSVPIGAKHRIDANKMLKIAKSMKDEVTLAPQFAPSWQKGSSGIGSRGSSQEGEKPLMPTNRYTALENLATSGSEVSERSSRFSAVTRNSLQTGSRHLPESSSDSRMFLSVSQDRSRNASQDRSEGELNPNQPQGAVSVPSLTAIDREPEKQTQPMVEELSREEIVRKATTILDEYFGVEDLKEAFMCVEELRSPNSLHVFVSFAINYVLEKKQHIMNLAGTLLNELLNKGVLDAEQFEKGLKDVLEDAENLAVDIPRFWEYLGDILASTISCHHQLWHLLRVACDELASCGKSENLFRRTIDAISIKVGSDKTCDALRKSGLRWSSYVSEGLFGYARQHSLEHLDPVREELIALMKQNSDNQPLFEWIQKNVSESEAESREFIRALVTAVCSCALTASDNATSENIVYVVSEDQILQRTPLLQRYLDHKPDREIQALYALQALMHSREHPRNTLNTFFEILYDKEIIAEEAFWDWKDSSDPAEQTGRGVALQSVRAFFDWLNEATEEQTGS